MSEIDLISYTTATFFEKSIKKSNFCGFSKRCDHLTLNGVLDEELSGSERPYYFATFSMVIIGFENQSNVVTTTRRDKFI